MQHPQPGMQQAMMQQQQQQGQQPPVPRPNLTQQQVIQLLQQQAQQQAQRMQSQGAAPAPASQPNLSQAGTMARFAPANTGNASGSMGPPPKRQRTEDDTWALPKRGVQLGLKAAGLDNDFKVDDNSELQTAMMELYGTLIENAVQFGCETARQRKSSVLKPRDMAAYLQRTWGIHVPGYTAEPVKPLRRPATSDAHQKRLVAVRNTNSQQQVQDKSNADVNKAS